MFTGAIKKQAEDLLKRISDFKSGTGLTNNFDVLDKGIYDVSFSILDTVVKPLALTVLSAFVLIELVKISTKVSESGGGNGLAAELIFKLLFKAALGVFVISRTELVLQAVYAFSQIIIESVDALLSTQAGKTELKFDQDVINAALSNISLGEQIGMIMELTIVGFAVNIVVGLSKVMILGRTIQLYLYFAISPIPLATLASEEMSQVGKNFLKNFTALCLQGFFMIVTMSFFSAIVKEITLKDFKAGIWQILLYCVMFGIILFGSQKFAKSICNAV